MGDLFQNGSAVLSPCGKYRYRLDRKWGDGPTCGFIMLNPSTADAEVDDPTIRRCIGFAKREGCGRLIVVNLYAYRSTQPAALAIVPDPHGGPEADAARHQAITEVDGPLVAAWGAWNAIASPAAAIAIRYGDRLLCLGRTKEGHPRHPLYVKGDAPLVRFA
jgi:hypothetical protein